MALLIRILLNICMFHGSLMLLVITNLCTLYIFVPCRRHEDFTFIITDVAELIFSGQRK